VNIWWKNVNPDFNLYWISWNANKHQRKGQRSLKKDLVDSRSPKWDGYWFISKQFILTAFVEICDQETSLRWCDAFEMKIAIQIMILLCAYAMSFLQKWMGLIDSRERRFPPTLILESLHLYVSIQFFLPDEMSFYPHKTIPKHT